MLLIEPAGSYVLLLGLERIVSKLNVGFHNIPTHFTSNSYLCVSSTYVVCHAEGPSFTTGSVENWGVCDRRCVVYV